MKKEGGSGMGEGRMDLGRVRKVERNLEGYGERGENLTSVLLLVT